MFKCCIKKYVKHKFLTMDVRLNGNQPWDIQVHDDRFYSRVFFHRSLGLGESYMDGWIESRRLDETIQHILSAKASHASYPLVSTLFYQIIPLLRNLQNKSRALIVGKMHYDLGNQLFECMLDKRMTYSCGYWKSAKTLDEAQEAKLDLICQKLQLRPGLRVLDIGCGWGSFAKYAAEKYGVEVVGITISKEQLELAKQRCKGLPIELRFQDYRDISGTFDRIASIGQMEHVGYKNYRNYMQIVERSLKDDGLFLLHTIGSNITYHTSDPWMEKYIFPNGMIPSIAQLAKASEGLFVMEDWHNFGAYYDKTLMAWFDNFDRNWDKLKAQYNERFYRMWKYYLLTLAGAFRARNLQLWQIVYSKRGIPGGYQSIR